MAVAPVTAMMVVAPVARPPRPGDETGVGTSPVDIRPPMGPVPVRPVPVWVVPVWVVPVRPMPVGPAPGIAMMAPPGAMAIVPSVMDGDRFRASLAEDRGGRPGPDRRTRRRCKRRGRRCQQQGDGARCKDGLQQRFHESLLPLRARSAKPPDGGNRSFSRSIAASASCSAPDPARRCGSSPRRRADRRSDRRTAQAERFRAPGRRPAGRRRESARPRR